MEERCLWCRYRYEPCESCKKKRERIPCDPGCDYDGNRISKDFRRRTGPPDALVG